MSVCVIIGAGERIPAERVEACVREGDYVIAAEALGIGYEALIGRIAESALDRLKLRD